MACQKPLAMPAPPITLSAGAKLGSPQRPDLHRLADAHGHIQSPVLLRLGLQDQQ